MNLDGKRAHAVLNARKAMTFAQAAIKQSKQELTGMREASHANKKEVADMVPGRKNMSMFGHVSEHTNTRKCEITKRET